MQYTAAYIASIISPAANLKQPDAFIEHLLTDSRQLTEPATSLFFALTTGHRSGAAFVAELYARGVRNFVVAMHDEPEVGADANVIHVFDPLAALQQLAAVHRQKFSFPVVGITGSNGKTVVKEWLYQLLHPSFQIVRSPRSYNSQIGVPLSVWQMQPSHTLGIFEAGISTVGEMQQLQQIIQPTIGVLTNIGEAHDAGFASRDEKLKEKWQLFSEATKVVAPFHLVQPSDRSKCLTWGTQVDADVRVEAIFPQKNSAVINLQFGKRELSIKIPFSDEASIQNAMTCFCVLLALDLDVDNYIPAFERLHSVDMRLQLKHALNNCLVVNDSYSADLTSLRIALQFQQQQRSGLGCTVILSDLVQTGKAQRDVYEEVLQLLESYQISKAIFIGKEVSEFLSNRASFPIQVHAYASTEDFISGFRSSLFYKEIILIKGARHFAFERIAALFEERRHGTVLEINLNALVQNVKQYQKLLKPSTKVMAMVKAFAYGSGATEIAGVLQSQSVDYLAVAYADEGVELVQSGIRLPIMVMNTEAHTFQAIVDHRLQPVIYSFDVLQKFTAYLKEQGLKNYPVHIELETGMNRLGFTTGEVAALVAMLAKTEILQIQSVFSHLAGSEDPAQDEFTSRQTELFIRNAALLKEQLPYPFLQHISNSAAIVRHPDLQMDMVRLGIGLYGIEVDAGEQLELQPVATLRSTIAQMKNIQNGESVSYNRRGVVDRDSKIATVRIGYADGYSRRFSNGVGKMWVRGQLAPVVGTVCMDMTMIDVTDIPEVQEGDDVVLFGNEISIQNVARSISTIPYEIMTRISQRVKRVYFHE
jgi:alanine racemase